MIYRIYYYVIATQASYDDTFADLEKCFTAMK